MALIRTPCAFSKSSWRGETMPHDLSKTSTLSSNLSCGRCFWSSFHFRRFGERFVPSRSLELLFSSPMVSLLFSLFHQVVLRLLQGYIRGQLFEAGFLVVFLLRDRFEYERMTLNMDVRLGDLPQ